VKVTIQETSSYRIGFPSEEAENSIPWSMFQHMPGSLSPVTTNEFFPTIPISSQQELNNNCTKVSYEQGDQYKMKLKEKPNTPKKVYQPTKLLFPIAIQLY
jgi:hypothetical protein